MKRALVITGIVCVAGIAAMAGFLATREEPPATETLTTVGVRRVDSGYKVTLKGGEELIYAGIRPPRSDEPAHDAARQRNANLVEGRDVRVRYDTVKRDEDNRLVAYVSVDEQLVNEVLVREGLAYVRLTPTTRRYADRLLAAQAAARKARVGVWAAKPPAPEAVYPADPQYGNFHRPTCVEVPKIKPERRVDLPSRTAAFDAGFAPCAACDP